MGIRRKVCIYSFCIGDILKTSTLELKELQECGATSNQTKMEGNQFSVTGMKLHPF